MDDTKTSAQAVRTRMTEHDLKRTLEGARQMAKGSCKRCYGTGVMGTRINSVSSKTILICHCVEKMAARIRAHEAAKSIGSRGNEKTQT